MDFAAVAAVLALLLRRTAFFPGINAAPAPAFGSASGTLSAALFPALFPFPAALSFAGTLWDAFEI